MKLTKAQKTGIREWLESNEPEQCCPFGDDDGLNYDFGNCLDICAHLFPRVANLIDAAQYTTCASGFLGSDSDDTYFCPCSNYTLAYVRRVARRCLK